MPSVMSRLEADGRRERDPDDVRGADLVVGVTDHAREFVVTRPASIPNSSSIAFDRPKPI
jgi:hypothetical protein